MASQHMLGLRWGVEQRLESRLAKLGDHELVGETRGRGLVGAIEMVADKKTKAPFDPKIGAGAKVNAAAVEHDLIGRAIGDNIAFTPPLIITESQIDELFDKMELALNDAAAAIHKAKAA